MKYLLSLALLVTSLSIYSEQAVPVESAIRAFYQKMQTEHDFSKDELDGWFEGVTVNQTIIDNMNRPAEKTLSWNKYRAIFVKDDRINQGLAFWQAHADTLARAEQTYGVPAHLIVGLIGVETRYGRIMGKHDIFRSLYTLAFHYPRRARFFSKELESFLVLTKAQNWQPGAIKGSYAGAMGYGQFMPSSYQAYAVDFDGDGKIHLIENVEDAIGSVANYIAKHRWQKGQPVVEQVQITNPEAKKLVSNSLKPNKTVAELRNAGVVIQGNYPDDTVVTLFKLEREQDEYWIGFQNFYVVSRYNPRIFYTKAVLDLADAIRHKQTRVSASQS